MPLAARSPPPPPPPRTDLTPTPAATTATLTLQPEVMAPATSSKPVRPKNIDLHKHTMYRF